jgi:hypothetical protein
VSGAQLIAVDPAVSGALVIFGANDAPLANSIFPQPLGQLVVFAGQQGATGPTGPEGPPGPPWSGGSGGTSGLINPVDFGALGDGAANDNAGVSAAILGGGIKIISNGNYLTPGTTAAFAHPSVILSDNAQRDGLPIPLLTLGRLHWDQLPQTYMFIRQDTIDRSDLRTVRIERIVNSDNGHTNPNALYVYTQKNHSNAQTEWAFSAVLDNYSNVAAQGDAALSGVARKHGTAPTFARHGQLVEMFKAAASTDLTGLVADEINVVAIGTDNPTANQIGSTGRYIGNRWGLVLIPITNTAIAGWDAATGNYGHIKAGAAIVIHNDAITRSHGTWLNGIVIMEKAGNLNPIDHGIVIHITGGRSLWLTGNVTGSHIQISGNAAYAFVASGTYSGSAWRQNAGETFGLEATNTIKFTYGTVANMLGFYSNVLKPTDATGERIGFNMSATPYIRIAGVKVIGMQNLGWTAMTGTGSKGALAAAAAGTASGAYVQAELQAALNRIAAIEARFKALDDMLFGHGLIAA